MLLSDELLKLRDTFFSMNSLASEYSFYGYLVWQKKYDFDVLNFDNSIVIQVKKKNAYRFPMVTANGNTNFFSDELVKKELISTIQQMIQVANSEKKTLVFDRITLEQKEFLEENFDSQFSFEIMRGDFDYLYDINSLCTLFGRKLSKKRNHVNGFLATYSDWKIEEISNKNINSLLDFSEKWYESKLKDDYEFAKENLLYEQDAVRIFVPQIEFLRADGIILYVNGKIAGFTVGQRLGLDAYDTVFEKADDKIRGSYNILNREFARYLKNKYPDLKYINRESDIDHLGLRQSKLSYMPQILLEKFKAQIIL